jgi:hypothetical protein
MIPRAVLLIAGATACGASKPARTQADLERCPLAALPRCRGTTHVFDAREAWRWGPDFSGKRVAVRGALGLKAWTCSLIPGPDPAGECASVRSMGLADVYVGPIMVVLSHACKCSMDGGRLCPVDSPGQHAVVTGEYMYSPGPHIGFPEDAPPMHTLKDVSICVE